MVDKVNFSSVNFRATTPDIKEVKVANTYKNNDLESEKKEGLYVDKETAEAIKNYMTNPINMNKAIALDDYKAMLVKSGLVEGKDFEVLKFEDRVSHKNSHAIRIADPKDPDKVRKVVFWKEGDGIENYDGCVDTYFITNGDDKESFSIHRDAKGRTTEQSSVYNNPDKHKNLFPENIDLNTTPEEYTKILDSKNVNYKVRVNQTPEGFGIVEVTEYGTDKKTVVKKTFFESDRDSKAIDQAVFNEEGKFMHATSLVDNDIHDGGYKLYITQSIDEILEAAKKISL